MSSNTTLRSVYANSAMKRIAAMRDYLEASELRDNVPEGYKHLVAEDCLIKLAPHIPGLADNADLTLQDKKFFYIFCRKLLCDLNDLKAAANCSEAALNLDPLDVMSISQHAGILKKLGRLDEAKECLAKGIKRCPSDKYLLTAMADIHRANGDGRMADDIYTRVTLIDPKDRKARMRLQIA